MTKTDRELKSATIQSEIVKRVKAIEQQKTAKKNAVANFNDDIKALENEKNMLLEKLEEAQREELTEDADDLLEANEKKD